MQHFSLSRAAIAVAALSTVGAAQAASGQIDSFSASALQVLAGDTVIFTVGYSFSTNVYQNGGGATPEPVPEEGYQYWTLNWYDFQYESLQTVSLQAAGQSQMESLYLPAGGGHAGVWQFSVLFPTAGSFDVTISGDAEVLFDIQQGAELASRSCYNTEYDGGPPNIQCDSWSYEYPEYYDYYTSSQGLGSMSLQVEVSAVPEPGTVALWLAGAGLLGASRLRRA